MSRNAGETPRSDRPGTRPKEITVKHSVLLLAALLVVIFAATVLALRSNETIAAVNPPRQALAPETALLPSHPADAIFPADTAPQPLAPPPQDLGASFADLERSVNAEIGVAVAPVGIGTEALALGGWTVGPAWSTIKVPLAIAALRQSPALTDAAAAAITSSDNGAADRLWTSLGDPSTAAASVEDILRETGDSTAVESRKVRPEFSAFGQTQWPLRNQAAFLAAAVCNPQNDFIIDLMTRVVGDQRWGLGATAGTPIKGGWGPSTSGAYLVRQFGIVDTPTGRAAVALAALPSSGSFSDGVTALNSVAQWLSNQSAQLPSGTC